MTASITLQNVSYKTNDGNVILRDVSVSFPFHRTGLIGDNGSGKTTALRLLAGEITPTSGQVIRSADAKILHLPQDYRLDTTATVTDTLGIDPSEIDSRAVWALVQVGLGDIELNRTIGTLSGGERMRVLLAKALMIEPDFLLLDEPTNNLDSESRTFVMDLIREWKRGLIVVSHDRELLDCVDGIVEMSALGAKSYGGNFELYRAQKSNESGAAARKVTEAKKELAGIKRRAQEKMESQEKRMRRGEKRRDSIGAGKAQMDFFANRAEATSGRNKKLFDDRLSQATNSLEEAKKSILPENRIVVDLGGTRVPSGKLVAAFHDMTFAYSPTENVIENFSLEIFGPERIAITGPNGSGKTTLVRLLTGELQPTSGEVKLGVTSWAYLDQHVRLLPQDKTLAQSVAERLGSDKTTARDWLGRFLFSQEAAKKLGRDLSGGERMRAALAYVLAGDAPPQLLILDEPTNNLDIRTTEQIESALQNFEGAIIAISHDQEFLRRIGTTKTIAI